MSIRINKWAGLVSYASPYFLPPGGAVEQVNACCLLPGQLTVRGGMEKVGDADGVVLEMWGFTSGPNTDRLFVFTDDGEITVQDAPVL